MENLMSREERKFITILATVAIWILLGLSFIVTLKSGMIENAANKILSSYFLMTMVIQTILATLIMGIGATSYVTVKQNNAYKKAQQMQKYDTEEITESEYIVE